MSEHTFSKKEALSFGWTTVTNNFLFFVGLVLIFWGVPGFFSYIAESVKDTEPLYFLILFVNWILSIILGLGLIYISLVFCDGKKPRYRDFLKPAHYFFRFLGASIIYGLIVFVGLLLFIVPGIIWSIKYGLYRYLIIDKDMGLFESIKKSGEITMGSKWNLFLLGLLLGLINVLGVLALGIGLLITVPISLMATTFVYRKLLSQSGGSLSTQVAKKPVAEEAEGPAEGAEKADSVD